ncbi:glycosyl hydrolase family 28 protein [Paenibacillus lactis]|uniref:glycosyl hydrolase family 28 protein n=1 Tax=Paenibacillus lactis TaxID=228574 RepID=UPI0004ADDE45
MNETKSALVTYPAPDGAVGNADFAVRVRTPGGEYQDLFTYLVRVDMHDVREASMATFDFADAAEVEITYKREALQQVDVRPRASHVDYDVNSSTILLRLDRPCCLSIEVNGDRFHNLHIFANALEEGAPAPESSGTAFIEAGEYEVNKTVRLLLDQCAAKGQAKRVIYFAPGLHWFKDGLFHIPSDTTVYLAGGSVIIGSLVCSRAENVHIRGRGVIYLRDIEKTTYWRSVEINYSRNVTVEDIISIDPPHYSIHLGQSENVRIRGFKSFSTRGWCDGIDMMACRNILIEDVFLRTSDDCIAIYASRGEYKGGTANVRVNGAVLWADVAHPVMIGVHGDHEGEGDTIENIAFHHIDILEHHEPQDGYWGCLAINAGDQNTVRNVTFNDVRIEPFELGRLFDIRVFHNPKYNPVPGNRVENVYFNRVSFNGACDHPSIIAGYDAARVVTGIHFRDLRLNGRHITSPEAGNFECNAYSKNITFE